jgi:NAD(P)-dependent dehydrogenase (short-subunit alcohol dehydrogenase family)
MSDFDLTLPTSKRSSATSATSTGRTVLVTGADGFMGSHLTDALVELGANVQAFVRATSSGR